MVIFKPKSAKSSTSIRILHCYNNMKVDFNREVLVQLLDQQSDKAITLADKFPKYKDWKEKRSDPTLNQLSQLAKFFQIPFGYFFLKNLPLRVYPIPHYRTNRQGPFQPSNDL